MTWNHLHNCGRLTSITAIIIFLVILITNTWYPPAQPMSDGSVEIILLNFLYSVLRTIFYSSWDISPLWRNFVLIMIRYYPDVCLSLLDDPRLHNWRRLYNHNSWIKLADVWGFARYRRMQNVHHGHLNDNYYLLIFNYLHFLFIFFYLPNQKIISKVRKNHYESIDVNIQEEYWKTQFNLIIIIIMIININ